jgi:hypothetical protein
MNSLKIQRTLAIGVLGLAVFSAGGCRALGFTDRVLWRVPSPDGSVVAVCQEIPGFDGPGFDVRLERPDGSLLQRLYTIGDGDPCSEIAWSSDGRTLAVLSGHVARVRFVDVSWALRHPSIPTAHWSWRQVGLSAEGGMRFGKDLRFVGPLEIEVTMCSYSLEDTKRTGRIRCTSAETRRRLRIPTPIVTGHTEE